MKSLVTRIFAKDGMRICSHVKLCDDLWSKLIQLQGLLFLSFKYRLFFSLNCYGLNIELEKALAHLVDIDMDVVFWLLSHESPEFHSSNFVRIIWGLDVFHSSWILKLKYFSLVWSDYKRWFLKEVATC